MARWPSGDQSRYLSPGLAGFSADQAGFFAFSGRRAVSLAFLDNRYGQSFEASHEPGYRSHRRRNSYSRCCEEFHTPTATNSVKACRGKLHA